MNSIEYQREIWRATTSYDVSKIAARAFMDSEVKSGELELIRKTAEEYAAKLARDERKEKMNG